MSSSVSVELPLRIINFVSLDPPPNRVEGSSVVAQSSWAQAPAAVGDTTDTMIDRVKTMETLGSPKKASSRPSPLPSQQRGDAAPEEQAKTLQHQKSLDFINLAIRSAAARRGVPAPTTSEAEATGLGIGIDESLQDQPTPTLSQLSNGSQTSYSSASTGAMNPSCMPYVHPHDLLDLLAQQRAVNVDDAEDSEDEDFGGSPNAEIRLNDDSIDEVHFVLGSTRIEDQVGPAFGLKASKPQSGPATGASPQMAELEISSADDEDVGDVTVTEIKPLPALPAEKQVEEDARELQQKASSASLASRISVKSANTTVPSTSKKAPRVVAQLDNSQSFGFASADAPLKTRSSSGGPAAAAAVAPASTAPTAATAGRRARARPEQFVDATPQESTLHPSSATAAAKTSTSSRRRRNRNGARKTSNGSSASGQSTPPLSDTASPNSSLAPGDSASRAGSSAASSVVATPEMGYAPLPAAPSFVDSSAMNAHMLSEKALAKLESVERKMETVSRPEVFSTPVKQPIAKLRATQSMANIKGQQQVGLRRGARVTPPPTVAEVDAQSQHDETSRGLSHSSSTHNLRGAAVVVPSVRNKIAALENRQATLRDFTKPEGGNGNVTPQGSSDEESDHNATPTRARVLASSAAGSASTPGRVATLAATAEAHHHAASGGSNPSPRVLRATASSSQLSRKQSTLSIASTVMSETNQLRRQPSTMSTMSFKAPVFKPRLPSRTYQ